VAKIKRPPEPSEFQIQCNIFSWAEIMSARYPELALLNASMNGALIQGPLKWQIIKNLQKSGCMVRGWPDLGLPISRCGYHALYIELKKEGEKPSEDQKRILRLLAAHQNYACVCEGEAATKRIILNYLQGEL
jgi:VRR-NUC domain